MNAIRLGRWMLPLVMGMFFSGAAMGAGNTPPVARGIARVTVNEDSPATSVNLFAAFDDAQDPDSKLKFSVVGNTDLTLLTTSINAAAGQLRLTFRSNRSGTSQVTVRCTDLGGKFVQTSFQVVVRAVSDAPTILPIDTQKAKAGLVFRLQIPGRDADLPNDTLQYGLDAASLNRGMMINPFVGLVQWTVPLSFAGQTVVSTVMVRDSTNQTATRTFSIEIAAPAVTTAPPLLALHDRTVIGVGQTVDLGALVAANDVTNGRTARIIQMRFPFSVQSTEKFQFSTNAQGVSLRYTNNGYHGTQVMNYTILDDQGRTDSGWLTIQAGNYVPPSLPPVPTPAIISLTIPVTTPPGTVIGAARVTDPDGGTVIFREADANLFPELKSNGGDAMIVTSQIPGAGVQPGEGLAPLTIDPMTGTIRFAGGVALAVGQVFVRNYLVFDGRTGTPAANHFNPNFGKIVVLVQ